MSFHDRLIDVFARNSVSNITSVADYQGLCREFKDVALFRRERAKIEETKIFVETYLDGAASAQEATKKAIDLLSQTRGDNRMRDLCHELITAGYKPHWKPEQQQYFDKAWETIKLEFDYFLSFTNRLPPGTPADNPINNDYKQFIINEIGPTLYDKTDKRKNNLLATAVRQLLSIGGVKAFDYRDSEFDNTPVDSKIEQGCNQCVTFIQLVQTVMFAAPGAEPNYCHIEWKFATKRFNGTDHEKRILYLVASKSRDEFLKVRPFVAYADWHTHVLKKAAPYLPEARLEDNVMLEESRQMVIRSIRDEITGSWLQLAEGVPI